MSFWASLCSGAEWETLGVGLGVSDTTFQTAFGGCPPPWVPKHRVGGLECSPQAGLSWGHCETWGQQLSSVLSSLAIAGLSSMARWHGR